MNPLVPWDSDKPELRALCGVALGRSFSTEFPNQKDAQAAIANLIAMYRTAVVDAGEARSQLAALKRRTRDAMDEINTAACAATQKWRHLTTGDDGTARNPDGTPFHGWSDGVAMKDKP